MKEGRWEGGGKDERRGGMKKIRKEGKREEGKDTRMEKSNEGTGMNKGDVPVY